jgi:hypothetical protein
MGKIAPEDGYFYLERKAVAAAIGFSNERISSTTNHSLGVNSNFSFSRGEPTQ